MTTTYTEIDLECEWRYRYEERLSILAGSAEPTSAQIAIATQEADEVVRKLKEGK